MPFVALLLPDCACGHVAGWHLTGTGRCAKRMGWRRRRCLCARYETI
jgi:hypothetical protein